MRSMLRSLAQRLIRLYAVDSNVSVGNRVHIGPGSRLWAPTRLTVDNDVYIGKRCTIEVDGHVGAGSMIANNVGIVGRQDHDMRQVGTTIRDARWVGHPSNKDLSSPVELKGDNWVGYGAIILGPVVVGYGAVIAAGSVVTRDVPSNAIVAGVPAEVVGERFTGSQLTEHLEKLGIATETSERTHN